MPEAKVTVTFLEKRTAPCSLRMPMPGTEKLDDDGNPIPGTAKTVQLFAGRTYNLNPVLADELLHGPAGLYRAAVVDGESIYKRLFIEGTLEADKPVDPAMLAAQIVDQQNQLEKLRQLMEDRGMIPEGELPGMEDGVVVAPRPESSTFDDDDDGIQLNKPVPETADATVLDGTIEIDEQGRLLCPICRQWKCGPEQPGGPKPKKQLSMHMVHCKKKHEAADAAEAVEDTE